MSEQEPKIPPKKDWPSLGLMQLYVVKSDMQTLYFNMKDSKASFANQYLRFISELDALIASRLVSEDNPE